MSAFRKNEERLQNLSLSPTEFVRRQVRVSEEARCSEAEREGFYRANFEDLMGAAMP